MSKKALIFYPLTAVIIYTMWFFGLFESTLILTIAIIMLLITWFGLFSKPISFSFNVGFKPASGWSKSSLKQVILYFLISLIIVGLLFALYTFYMFGSWEAILTDGFVAMTILFTAFLWIVIFVLKTFYQTLIQDRS